MSRKNIRKAKEMEDLHNLVKNTFGLHPLHNYLQIAKDLKNSNSARRKPKGQR